MVNFIFRLTSLLVSVIIAFLIISCCACAQPLFSRESEEIVTKGVVHKKTERFYGDYALTIDYIIADLKEESLSLELLKNSGGVDKTDTVLNLAKNTSIKHGCEYIITEPNLSELANLKDIKIIGLTDENLSKAIIENKEKIKIG